VPNDIDGKRGGAAGRTIGQSLSDIGIKDQRKVFHSHRHTFKTRCRVKIDRENRNYITGHASEDIAAEYGDYLIEMLADELAKIPDPLSLRP
jgi:hypothetical protein